MAKKRRDVEERIIPASDADPYVKVLVFGRNGVGKTIFAATAPNVLIVDINERGTRSVRHSGASVFHARSWRDIAEVYWWLKAGNHEFESVAIDTITAMNSVCINHVLKEGVERDPTRDPRMIRRQDWGKVAQFMRPMLLQLRNLPMHVIFIAQERTEGDPEEGEEIIHTVDLPAGSRGAAKGAVEVIGYLYRREVKRKDKKTEWETRMLIGDHERYETKDRTLVLPRVVRNPTVPKIIAAAFNGKE